MEDAAPASAAAITPTQGAQIAEVGAVVERHGEAGHRADQHHALEPEIEHAALLDHEFAGRGEQDRRRHADPKDDGVDDVVHATASAGAARGASRTIRNRYRTRMSLARMKNSIIAWKMPAVALGTCTTVCATWPPT